MLADSAGFGGPCAAKAAHEVPRGSQRMTARTTQTAAQTAVEAAMDPAGSDQRPLRVLHFVSGGFSGATSVATTLVRAAADSPHQRAWLVLRRKRLTDPARVQALRDAELQVELVPGWSRLATVWCLVRLCWRLRPDVLVAHGFSEHLWGRYAGWLAGVPALVHVEHNTRERYGLWRLLQARWLARRTARIVGCSEGVRRVLADLGFPPDRVTAIPNGVAIEPFAAADAHPYAQRLPGLVMVARFSGQKDHATLLQALALLSHRGLRPSLELVGTGSARHRRRAEAMVRSLGLSGQVHFAGHSNEVPLLLMRHQICVLSTHYEGMPLALVEGMVAGCAVVGSAVPGVQELIADGEDGRLVPPRDPAALADVLESLLRDPARAAELAARARARSLVEFSRARMTAGYEAMLLGLDRHPD